MPEAPPPCGRRKSLEPEVAAAKAGEKRRPARGPPPPPGRKLITG